MSSFVRLPLLLGIVLVLFGLALWQVDRAGDAALDRMQADRLAESARLFARAVTLQSAGLEVLTSSYA